MFQQIDDFIKSGIVNLKSEIQKQKEEIKKWNLKKNKKQKKK